MNVRVQLFAVARQLAGSDEVAVDVVERATIAELQRSVVAAVPALAGVLGHARWAVDAEFVDAAHRVQPGAEVALIPPVSGG